MRNIMTASRQQLEAARLQFDYALISFRDPCLPACLTSRACLRLDLVLHDLSQDLPNLPGPQQQHAAAICAFAAELPPELPLIIQCEAGIGRSAATAAALMRHQGDERYRELLKLGTYNRRLYRLLSAELGLDVPVEPLVALAVRVKYPLDRAAAFLMSLRRQRYENWRCFMVLDGPQEHATGSELFDGVTWIETTVRRGLWGHPYRQLGIDHCLAAGATYVGLNNDDNYLTPGYLEQLVAALQETGADLVLCQTLHACIGWQVIPSEPRVGCVDIGNWLAAADLIRQVPFHETDYFADGRFVERMAAKARSIVRIERPLFVKN